jgi:adenosine deaminase
MEHSFLPGADLWATPDDFRAAAGACKGETLGSANPSGNCSQFLSGSQKASAQWELERRFTDFEAKFQGPTFDRLLHGH